MVLNTVEDGRSTHLTWGGVWEFTAKEIFSIYLSDAFDSTSEYDEVDMKGLAAAAGKKANIVTDELLMQAYGYCRTNGIDPNKPIV